jgi:hypothetical protein
MRQKVTFAFGAPEAPKLATFDGRREALMWNEIRLAIVCILVCGWAAAPTTPLQSPFLPLCLNPLPCSSLALV